MFGSDKRYLSISINEAAVKVAQVKSSGLVEKVACGAASDAADKDQLAKILKGLLNGFDRKASVFCVIPANAATAKNIEVPSSDPEEIKSIINLQASRHTPYSREEVLISYSNCGAGTANNTKILLVIAHRNVVKDRVDVLEKAGLNPDRIVFVPEGIARFYAKALNLKKDAAPIGVIDVSVNAIHYIILARGTLAFVRHIPIGVKAIMEGADAQAKLIEEFNKSIAAFANEDIGQPPESYVITTDHEAVRNLLPALEEALKVHFRASPFTHFIKGSAAIKRKLDKEYADDSFLDVIAPVVVANKCDVNLMPEEMIHKKTVERQSKEGFRAGITALVMMILIVAISMSRIYFKDTFLNKNLREQYSVQRKEVEALEARINKTKIVHDYLQKRMVTLDTIHELYAVTPKTVYLNNINMDEDGSLTIDGVADSMSEVFSYVKALDDSPMFKAVKTKSTATKKERNKDVAAFEITFKLEDSSTASNTQ